ncbi:MAG: hypothetical protein ABUL62_03045 [Myxococcales bacterium]
MSLRRTLILGSIGVATSLVGLSGCSSSSADSTTGKRVVLHTNLTANSIVKSTFTTGFKWDVTLTKASLAVSAFYYFDGPPPTALFKVPRRKRTFGERVSNFLVGTAFAHPGHYQAGTALGESILPKPIAFDLFTEGPVALNDGDGVTGVYRSARFVLPTTAPADAALSGHLAVAEGTALKHDDATAEPIYFRLIADYDDIAMNVNDGAVDGCVLDETTVTSDGTITVEIEPTVWFNLVDFSKIDAGSADSPTEARSPGFSQGLTELSAYHFSYSK